MACGGCKKGNSTRHTSTGGDLTQFAFLSPRQLRHLKSIEDAQAPEPPPEGDDE
jgi:hypothetical protein